MITLFLFKLLQVGEICFYEKGMAKGRDPLPSLLKFYLRETEEACQPQAEASQWRLLPLWLLLIEARGHLY